MLLHYIVNWTAAFAIYNGLSHFYTVRAVAAESSCSIKFTLAWKKFPEKDKGMLNYALFIQLDNARVTYLLIVLLNTAS